MSDPFADGTPVGDFHHWEEFAGLPIRDRTFRLDWIPEATR